MNKLYLVGIFTFFPFQQANCQCLLQLEQLENTLSYTISKFDTFALKNGFTFNSKLDLYVCDEEKKSDKNILLGRSTNNNGEISISHAFYDKNHYLVLKSILEEKAESHLTTKTSYGLNFNYIYNEKLFLLFTKSIDDFTLYYIIITNKAT